MFFQGKWKETTWPFIDSFYLPDKSIEFMLMIIPVLRNRIRLWPFHLFLIINFPNNITHDTTIQFLNLLVDNQLSHNPFIIIQSDPQALLSASRIK